jgi:alpha-beta hydrolase superfamily lysophospholipase
MTQHKLSTVTTGDGVSLRLLHWRLPQAKRQVVIVHGLGEHAGRYQQTAEQLLALGCDVLAYDQYGHGKSQGKRGHLASDDQLLEHLRDVWRAIEPAAPTRRILLGHSLGGLLAAAAVARGFVQPDALVLSSPALAVDMAAWQRAAVRWLPRLVPNLTLGNGLNADYLSHDRRVVEAYRQDTLVHDRICARLGAFVANAGEQVLQQAPQWHVPTLLLYAGEDRLVSPRGSDAFASVAPRARVTSKRFDGLYHEIFNEADAAPVFKALADWLAVAG